MRALRLTAPGAAQVISTEEPTVRDGEALIAPRYVGLCGTDHELYAGVMPYLAGSTGGVRVQVSPDDLDRAREVLGS